MTDNTVMIPVIELSEDKDHLQDIGRALEPKFEVNRTFGLENIKKQLLAHIAEHEVEPSGEPELTTAPKAPAETAPKDAPVAPAAPATDDAAEVEAPPEAGESEQTEESGEEESLALDEVEDDEPEAPKPRMLRHRKNGREFIWSAELAKNPDLMEVGD